MLSETGKICFFSFQRRNQDFSTSLLLASRVIFPSFASVQMTRRDPASPHLDFHGSPSFCPLLN